MIQKASVEPRKSRDGVLQHSDLRYSNILSVWGPLCNNVRTSMQGN